MGLTPLSTNRKMLNYRRPVVRGYKGWALVPNRSKTPVGQGNEMPESFDILENHLMIWHNMVLWYGLPYCANSV